MTAPPVMCGKTTCTVPGQDLYNLLAGFAAGFGFPLPAGGAGLLQTACCTTDNACGLVVAGTGCVGRPASDPTCPDVNLLGVDEPGCCIESQGICGVNGAQSGMGCMDVSGTFGALLGVPAPTSCGHTEDGGEPDAAGPVMMSMPDARVPDATTPDAHTPDATTPDATTPDATTPDAHTSEDAGQ